MMLIWQMGMPMRESKIKLSILKTLNKETKEKTTCFTI